jgi:hypothetical protein
MKYIAIFLGSWIIEKLLSINDIHGELTKHSRKSIIETI